MPRQPEGKLVAKMKKVIKAAGGRSFKIHGSDEGFQEIGIPDLLVCLRGRFVGIEAKQPGESLRPRQRVVLHEIHAAGGVAAVCETVEQLQQLLSHIEEERVSEKGTDGICYDRGSIRRNTCVFE
jgi:hypothetical protein